MVEKENNSTITFTEIVEQYNGRLEQAAKLNFFVRDIDLQKEMIEDLKGFKLYIKSFKAQARDKKDENSANHFFHMQCVLNAWISSLSIWISLKESTPYSAWNNLIDAQEYLSYAVRVSDDGIGIDEFKEHLKKIEDSIFPGFPLYNSLGIIMRGGVCSICNEPLETCEHIGDEIYLGSVCRRIKISDINIDHGAIVENPKDRRCIITEFEFSPGKIHDYITLKYLRDENTSKSEGTKMTAVMYNMNELDLS